jgi:hypothetical protein
VAYGQSSPPLRATHSHPQAGTEKRPSAELKNILSPETKRLKNEGMVLTIEQRDIDFRWTAMPATLTNFAKLDARSSNFR